VCASCVGDSQGAREEQTKQKEKRGAEREESQGRNIPSAVVSSSTNIYKLQPVERLARLADKIPPRRGMKWSKFPHKLPRQARDLRPSDVFDRFILLLPSPGQWSSTFWAGEVEKAPKASKLAFRCRKTLTSTGKSTRETIDWP
jgi:hypothetical protein